MTAALCYPEYVVNPSSLTSHCTEAGRGTRNTVNSKMGRKIQACTGRQLDLHVKYLGGGAHGGRACADSDGDRIWKVETHMERYDVARELTAAPVQTILVCLHHTNPRFGGVVSCGGYVHIHIYGANARVMYACV